MVAELEVGRITKPHGLRGEVLVRFTTDKIAERTSPGSRLRTAAGTELTVRAARAHRDRWIVSFAGSESRDDADALRGQLLFAEPLEDSGELFIHELIGKRLRTSAGTEHGEIVAVVANPASDLMELADGRLVPLAFYQDHDEHVVTVDVPAGLLDDDSA